MELNAAASAEAIEKAVRPSGIATESGLRPSPAIFPSRLFSATFLKFKDALQYMAKNDNQVSMPSSQGGLVQYMDADTGIEVDPKMVIAFGFLVSVLGIGLHL
jgi:preprotein translocase subunit Sec61beta